MPALDGVRALAVAAVLAYHGGVPRAAGGFVGVDVFFVLSGFLITSLLLAEHHDTGRLRLGRFWARRARRLLPALLAMLVAVAAYAAWLAPPDTLDSLRRSALATLLYVANWAQMTSGQGYFAQLAAPSPLLHTWSLAIEEQFYVIWPLLVLALLWIGRRLWGDRPARRVPLLTFTGAGAVVSAVAMAVLYRSGVGVNRVYYGTDTRSQDLLIGAALAVVLAWRAERGTTLLTQDEPSGPGGEAGAARGRSRPVATGPWPGRLAGAGALAVVVGTITTADGSSAWLYRGGFAGVCLATAVLLAVLVLRPAGAWARLFSLAPLRYLGRISYGLYLWHWPIFVVLDGARTGLAGWPLFSLRAGASVAVAALSYHGLEMPIRSHGLKPWAWRACWPAAVGTVTAAVLVATVVPAGADAALDLTASASPASAARLAPGVVSELPSVPAGAGGPVRVLLVGDSMAVSLVFGLGPGSQDYDVDLQSDGVIGCGLVTAGLVTNRGISAPETGGLRAGAQWVQCATWPERWANDVARFHPDVVALLAGPWEVRNRYLDGRWIHIGEPAFDRLEETALDRAVDVLGSQGARVVLLTSPYFSQPEQADGRPQPDDAPVRVEDYNAMLRQTARAHPRTVTVVDLGARVSPGGHFSTYVGGVDMRDSDGLHLTEAGAHSLQPWLLPVLHQLGMAQRRLAAVRARPVGSGATPGS